MDYLTIFLLTRANTAFFGCSTDEANASADFLLEKISNQETSANSELTFTIHTNFFITTLSKDFQNGEEPFPHSSPTIIPYRDPLVKTNLSRGSRFGEEPFSSPSMIYYHCTKVRYRCQDKNDLFDHFLTDLGEHLHIWVFHR